MRKLGILATAGIMSLTAVTATLGAAGEAEARHRRSGEVIAGAAIGLLGGVLLGQALAPPPAYGGPVYGGPGYGAPAYYPPPAYHPPVRPRYYQPRPVYVQPRVIYREPVPVYRHRHVGGDEAHVSWCANRYRSYSPYNNTWVSYSGRVRQCVSPYSY